MSNSGINGLMDVDDDDQFDDPEMLLQRLLDDPHLTQHVTRSEHDGSETLIGYFRIKLQPGQLRHVLHVPFEPAFQTIPSVEINVTDHDSARARITDRQKFGMRVEIILAQPSAENQTLLVEVCASEQ